MGAGLQMLPLAQGLRGYRLSSLRGDVSAGLAVAAVGLPSALAYPAIAGLPAETGLYASIAPLVAYAIFGPSRQLVVGPDAGTMTVLAAAMAAVLTIAPEADRVAMAAAMALCVGGLCLLARALHLGIVASFLSRPILVGFFAGISLSIIIGQLSRVTGLALASDGLLLPLIELARESYLIHWHSLILAVSMFALMQLATRLRSPIPGPVLVVVISIALSYLLEFEDIGIRVVGDIPAPLPTFSLPAIADLPLAPLLSGSAAIFLVSFGAGIVTARSFAARGGHQVDADGELLGFGAANLAAGLTGAFPVTASDSRTAINLSVGGKSQIVSLVAAGALVLTLLFLTDSLRILPVPVLGAILIAAALNLIDIAALRQIWRVNPMEFGFAMIAALGPISLGVLYGVVVAIGATLLYLLRQMMFPRDAMLGRIPGRDGFYKLHRNPLARPVPGMAIALVQGSLLFFNADHVGKRLRAIADALPPGTKWFVIDASAIVQVDSTGAATLDAVIDELEARGVRLGLAELHADAQALLMRAGVLDRIGRTMIFDDLEDALQAFKVVETGSTKRLPSDAAQ